MSRAGSGRRGVLAALAVLAAGCFETPIEDAVDVTFLDGGGAEVTVTTKIASPGFEKNAAVRSRIAAAREEARCGTDAWTRQLESLEPAAFRRSVSGERGDVRETARVARFEDAEVLRRLFEPAPLFVSVRRDDAGTTLEIVPSRASRATANEQRRTREALEGFAAATATYVREAASLTRYLDRNPGRDRPVFRKLLVPPLKDPGGDEEPLSDEETSTLDRLEEAMSAVSAFLAVEEGSAESLDELARRVYDPFPAPLTVTLPGPALETAGFVKRADGRWAVPQLGLLGALESLRGRWIDPDPLFTALGRGEEVATLDAFLAIPRVASPPIDAATIRTAIESKLRTEPVYRLRWASAPK